MHAAQSYSIQNIMRISFDQLQWTATCTKIVIIGIMLQRKYNDSVSAIIIICNIMCIVFNNNYTLNFIIIIIILIIIVRTHIPVILKTCSY